MNFYSNSLSKRRLWVVIVIALLMLQSATIPYRHQFRMPLYLTPVTIWKLKLDGSGQVTGIWQKSSLREQVSYLMFHFNRPDIVDIRLSDQMKEGNRIHKGDVVGWVQSREMNRSLPVTEAQLKHAQAEELALKAGGRTVDIKVAQENLKSAEIAMNAYEPEFQRFRSLFATKQVAEAEFQQIESKYNLLKSAYELALAKVHALEAGSRNEDVLVAQAEVDRLNQQLTKEKNILGNEEPIYSPIDGIVQLGGERDVLFAIQRTDTLDATLILPDSYAPFVRLGKPVSVQLFASPEDKLTATISNLEYCAGDTAGIRAHMLLPNPTGSLSSGMEGFGVVYSDRMTLLRSLRIRSSQWNQLWSL